MWDVKLYRSRRSGFKKTQLTCTLHRCAPKSKEARDFAQCTHSDILFNLTPFPHARIKRTRNIKNPMRNCAAVTSISMLLKLSLATCKHNETFTTK